MGMDKEWRKTKKGVVINIVPGRRKGIPKYTIRFGKKLMEEVGEGTKISTTRPRKLEDLNNEVFTIDRVMKILMELHYHYSHKMKGSGKDG